MSFEETGRCGFFWNTFLTNEMINWPDKLKDLIHIVLTLPIGSSEVERGFSILHNINIKTRNRLSAKHLEDIVRIRINGPPIEKFNAISYTLHWLSSGHITVDDSRKNRQKKNNESISKLFCFR